MLGTRTRFALDNFIEEKYFEEGKNHYILKETAEKGKSELSLFIY